MRNECLYCVDIELFVSYRFLNLFKMEKLIPYRHSFYRYCYESMHLTSRKYLKVYLEMQSYLVIFFQLIWFNKEYSVECKK